MARLGLIGGMSWESTAVYYRHLNALARLRGGGLRSADLLLHSLDFAQVVARQKAGDWNGAATMLADSAEWLVRGGAQAVLICTNTMHLVADTVAARIAAVRPQARLIDIIDETATALARRGCRQPLLLATRYTMEHGFYAERMAGHGIAVRVPGEAQRRVVHDVIFDELCRGIIRPDSRERLLRIVEDGLRDGADSVILGCTEICLLLDPDALPCPGFDSTLIHAEAAASFTFGQPGEATAPGLAA